MDRFPCPVSAEESTRKFFRVCSPKQNFTETLQEDRIMKLHKKQLLAMGLAAGLSVLSVIPAMAGEWAQLEGGEFWQKRYVEADGTYPTSTWKEIDGNVYYFDQDGFTVTGWRFIDQNWYYFETNGVRMSNLVCNGGRLDENGLWVTDKIPPTSSTTATPEDTTYWTAKLIEYNLMDKEFQANADGSFSMTCAYDLYATRPDLLNTVFAKAAYTFPQGFSYEWSMINGIFNFKVTNVGSAQ
ncbi:MAG: hypothetical protein HFG50_12275 [Lachnospiraceae bacterium]|nr:hypothetical protein [Lachnospiraceae bacterium]